MGKRKAPGYEGINAEILRRAWPIIKGKLLKIMIRALMEGKFPEPLKIRLVKYLYKGGGIEKQ